MLKYVAAVRTEISEEFSASIIRVTRIDELRTTIALTINIRTLRRDTICSSLQLLVTANTVLSSPILSS
jgi:hypothetical protein